LAGSDGVRNKRFNDDFETKIIGLIGVAGGHMGAINSLNAMKTICRNLHCWVLPQEVLIAAFWWAC
jgi:NAD(P)H-dependent FMN reductase